ncbi:MAG: hypothetical protein EBZ59_10115 [Planctomycetia bacterium]|nr:hypothetical protein [Planctomycetia bacterium]
MPRFPLPRSGSGPRRPTESLVALEALEARVCLDGSPVADEAMRAAAARALFCVAQPAAALAVPKASVAAAKSAPVATSPAPARIDVQGPSQAVLRGTEAVFTVTLSAPPGAGKTFSVRYATVDGGARAGVHYVRTSGTLVFTGTETSKTVSVPTIADSPGRFPKVDAFSLQLSSPTRGTKIIGDLAIAKLAGSFTSIAIDNPTVAEGNSGSTVAAFSVSLTGPNAKVVTVDYETVDGTATTADGDYEAARGRLTFQPGETSKTVAVQVRGDLRQEPTETFRLRLLNPSGNATLLQPFGTATIVDDDGGTAPTGGGFQITLEYATSIWGPVPKAVRDACEYAATRWSQVITGDLPDVTDPSLGTIDDFYMTVSLGLLDEPRSGNVPGGTLANAMPIKFRSGASSLPYLGIAGVDPRDADRPELKDILLHEMGHALGFLGGFAPFDNYVKGNGFTGPNAVREYRSIFGNAATSVPLETGGGAGTAGSHWDETIFKTELMTGYVDKTMQLSRITAGAMQDIGYTVNYAAADVYAKPAGLAASAKAAPVSAAASIGSLAPAAALGSSARPAAVQMAPPRPAPDGSPVTAASAGPSAEPSGSRSPAQPQFPFPVRRPAVAHTATAARPLARQVVFAALGQR